MTIQLNTQALIAILSVTLLACLTVGYLGGRYYTMMGYVLVETSTNDSAVDMHNRRLDTLAGKYEEFQPKLVTPEEPTR